MMAQRLPSFHRRLILLTGLLAWSTVGLLLAHAEFRAEHEPARIRFSSSDIVGLSAPVRLKIGSITVDAPVIPVGLDPEGNMDIPKSAQEIGWYSLGAAPGEQGNAVMAGHLDTVRLTPGVFAELSTLPVGELIVVEDATGAKLLFRVAKRAVYPYNEAPLREIFGPSEKRRLILITCQGTWSDAEATYSDRYVVYAELVEGVGRRT